MSSRQHGWRILHSFSSFFHCCIFMECWCGGLFLCGARKDLIESHPVSVYKWQTSVLETSLKIFQPPSFTEEKKQGQVRCWSTHALYTSQSCLLFITSRFLGTRSVPALDRGHLREGWQWVEEPGIDSKVLWFRLWTLLNGPSKVCITKGLVGTPAPCMTQEGFFCFIRHVPLPFHMGSTDLHDYCQHWLLYWSSIPETHETLKPIPS